MCLSEYFFSLVVLVIPRKNYSANFNQKKAKVAILTSDKIDIRAKKITRGGGRLYIMIKRSIHQGDITLLNMYTANIRSRN